MLAFRAGINEMLVRIANFSKYGMDMRIFDQNNSLNLMTIEQGVISLNHQTYVSKIMKAEQFPTQSQMC